MAQPSVTTISNSSVPNREAGWFHPDDLKVDQFLLKLPFEGVESATTQFEFNRADSIPSVTFKVRGGTKSVPATNVTLNTVAFERCGEHCELDTFDFLNGRECDNMEMQIRGLKLGILRQLSLQLIEGTATPNILGLRAIAGQTLGAANGAANGGFLTLQDLYKGKYLVKTTNDFVGTAADCWVSNEKTLREVLGMLDAVGQDIPWCFDEQLGIEVPIVRGMPWYISDAVPNNETKGAGTNLTSVYIVKMSGPTGIRLMYAKSSTQECDEFGIFTYPIPIQETKDTRLAAVEGYYALVKPEWMAVIRIDGVNNTQYAI